MGPTPRPTSGQHRVEEHAAQTAAACLAVGFTVAFAAFRGGTVPLSATGAAGTPSIGAVAAVVAAAEAVAVFAAAYVRSHPEPVRPRAGPRRRRIGWVRLGLDAAALAFAHGAIAYFAALSLFRVFQDAFLGLRLGALAAGLLVALAGAVVGYVCFLAAVGMSSATLANVLAVFLLVGVVNAMVNSSAPDWWKLNISLLGRTGQASAWPFNITLVVAGTMVTTLAHYITADLRSWARCTEGTRVANIRPVSVCVALLGIGLALVGLVPVDRSVLLHRAAGVGLTLAFAVLVVGLRFWVPALGRTFHLLSLAFAAGIVLCVVLYRPLGYYNLTAMELIAVGIVLCWLVVLMRFASALASGLREGSFPRRAPPA